MANNITTPFSREHIVNGVGQEITWWIKKREEKLVNQLSTSMALNPLMAPIVFEFHAMEDINNLFDVLINAHLMVGHATGFGKLIDEKILPKVFSSTKISSVYRATNDPFINSSFDEIDHLVVQNGRRHLLSLKASRWTIQLTMAVQLNNAFNSIRTRFAGVTDEIVVGVYYGTVEQLTDKYDILRGINRGANHDVVDLTSFVNVYAGKDFWAWLNLGEPQTQEWVFEGIEKGIKAAKPRERTSELLSEYNKKIVEAYSPFLGEDGEIDWLALLKSISG